MSLRFTESLTDSLRKGLAVRKSAAVSERMMPTVETILKIRAWTSTLL